MSRAGEKRDKKNRLYSRAFQKRKKLYMTAVVTILLGSGVLMMTSGLLSPGKKTTVQAADSLGREKISGQTGHHCHDSLPAGIAGLLSGVSDRHVSGTRILRIGTSAETVMVGQRVQTVTDHCPFIDCASVASQNLARLSEKTGVMAVNATLMTDYDYENLCRIVEAEAGTEDIKGRVLVANVIMNRVANQEFPNNITDVIYQYEFGVAQFSPVADGKIYSVTVTDETREAVRQAMEGVDYSEGALFFIQKDAADKGSIRWFDQNLKHLFKYGVHEFYKYP